MPVNHAKEFLKSVHNEALFSHLFSRTLIEVSSVNFKAKFLKMASINSEFLNVSMVEPAPESATTLVSLLRMYVYTMPEVYLDGWLTDFAMQKQFIETAYLYMYLLSMILDLFVWLSLDLCPYRGKSLLELWVTTFLPH